MPQQGMCAETREIPNFQGEKKKKRGKEAFKNLRVEWGVCLNQDLPPIFRLSENCIFLILLNSEKQDFYVFLME